MKLLALIAAAALGATAPVALNRAYRVAWKHTLIAQPTLLEFKPRELGGPHGGLLLHIWLGPGRSEPPTR